jgi:hypothetical protein
MVGKPQSHAYDVVYRHALALDEAGNRLAFGSTTGGLWVSEDQGDSWLCVTHTLPPIYSCGSHDLARKPAGACCPYRKLDPTSGH